MTVYIQWRVAAGVEQRSCRVVSLFVCSPKAVDGGTQTCQTVLLRLVWGSEALLGFKLASLAVRKTPAGQEAKNVKHNGKKTFCMLAR